MHNILSGQMIMSLRSAPPLEGLRDYSFDQSVMLLSRIGAMSGRVKMSKFLLTACAFGLLLSFAFAEEKSPEQHREESNQMLGVEGVQKMELTRVVASGINQRIYFFYAVHPDCFASDIHPDMTVFNRFVLSGAVLAALAWLPVPQIGDEADAAC